LRRSYPEITALGAEVVAVGTGSVRYAQAFVADEDVPFPVLVDDDGDAADAASVRRASWFRVAGPKSWPGTVRVWREGHRIHKAGKRVTQLGATFVVGPGDVVRYEHYAGDSSDHAPIGDVLGVLQAST
jgi:peroxiredoxin